MENSVRNRNLLASLFWLVSATAYVAAAMPLLMSSDELTKQLGGACAVFITVGIIVNRLKFAVNVYDDEKRFVSASRVTQLRLLSHFVLLLTSVIAFGYVAKFCNGLAWNSSLNYIVIPFGLLFFYYGKWCFVKPGAD